MSLTVIVAATRNNGIGQGSKLPWRLPQEMAYFAKTTSQAPEGHANAVIMGRTTWESIPKKFRPLKNRINLVASQNASYLSNEELDQNTITDASTRLALVTNLREELASTVQNKVHGMPIHRSFIIGGASLYRAALDPQLGDSIGLTADRILMTRILAPSFENCDTFFPEFRDLKKADGGSVWSQASHEEFQKWVGVDVPKGTQTEKGVEYEFQMWVRAK